MACSTIRREPSGRAKVASSASGVDLCSNVAGLAFARSIARRIGVVGTGRADDTIDRDGSSRTLETVSRVGKETAGASRASNSSLEGGNGSWETGLADTVRREGSGWTRDAEAACAVWFGSRRASVARASVSIADGSVGTKDTRSSFERVRSSNASCAVLLITRSGVTARAFAANNGAAHIGEGVERARLARTIVIRVESRVAKVASSLRGIDLCSKTAREALASSSRGCVGVVGTDLTRSSTGSRVEEGSSASCASTVGAVDLITA